MAFVFRFGFEPPCYLDAAENDAEIIMKTLQKECVGEGNRYGALIAAPLLRLAAGAGVFLVSLSFTRMNLSVSVFAPRTSGEVDRLSGRNVQCSSPGSFPANSSIHFAFCDTHAKRGGIGVRERPRERHRRLRIARFDALHEFAAGLARFERRSGVAAASAHRRMSSRNPPSCFFSP